MEIEGFTCSEVPACHSRHAVASSAYVASGDSRANSRIVASRRSTAGAMSPLSALLASSSCLRSSCLMISATGVEVRRHDDRSSSTRPARTIASSISSRRFVAMKKQIPLLTRRSFCNLGSIDGVMNRNTPSCCWYLVPSLSSTRLSISSKSTTTPRSSHKYEKMRFAFASIASAPPSRKSAGDSDTSHSLSQRLSPRPCWSYPSPAARIGARFALEACRHTSGEPLVSKHHWLLYEDPERKRGPSRGPSGACDSGLSPPNSRLVTSRDSISVIWANAATVRAVTQRCELPGGSSTYSEHQATLRPPIPDSSRPCSFGRPDPLSLRSNGSREAPAPECLQCLENSAWIIATRRPR